MSEQIKQPELKAVEAALTTLTPAASAINRDQLMFCAGQAAARRGGWLWPATAAAMGMLALTLAIAGWTRPTPQPTERIVFVPAPPPESPSTPESEPTPAGSDTLISEEASASHNGNLLQMRRYVVRWGADALPAPAPVEAAPKKDSPSRVFDRLSEL